MKKLIGFLIVAGLISCTCIGQVIKTQTIYAGINCQAPLPDYTIIVTVSDNCSMKTYTQTPIAGTMLTSANPTLTVTLRAEDKNGNIKTKSFQVVLLDTIKPIFNFPSNMLAYDVQEILNGNIVFGKWTQEDLITWLGNEGWDSESYKNWIETNDVYYYPIQVSNGMFNAYLNK